MQEKLQKMLENALGDIKNFISSENVVAKPIFINDMTYIIPLSKISVGFASGGGEYGNVGDEQDLPFAGGSGGGVTITPMGVVVGSQGKHNYIKLNEKETENKWADLISSIINIVK